MNEVWDKLIEVRMEGESVFEETRGNRVVVPTVSKTTPKGSDNRSKVNEKDHHHHRGNR